MYMKGYFEQGGNITHIPFTLPQLFINLFGSSVFFTGAKILIKPGQSTFTYQLPFCFP